MNRSFTLLVIALVPACSMGVGEQEAPPAAPASLHCFEPPTAPPTHLGLDLSFYTKYIDARGVPIVAAGEVSDDAFPVACTIVSHMVSMRPDIVQRLADLRIRVGIIGRNQVVTDMPEYRQLVETFGPTTSHGRPWDSLQGLGATPQIPLSSVIESNLLPGPNESHERFSSILVHEFGHTMYDLGLAHEKDAELERIYNEALAAGRQTTGSEYAESNTQEYWATGVQAWYNAMTGFVSNREQLWAADPQRAAMMAEVFPDDDFVIPFGPMDPPIPGGDSKGGGDEDKGGGGDGKDGDDGKGGEDEGGKDDSDDDGKGGSGK